MVNVKNRPANESEDVEKLTELYIKLEKIQGYIRRIKGRINKYSMELEAARKLREEKESKLIKGVKAKKSKVSDQTI